jgi:hypothetical protein
MDIRKVSQKLLIFLAIMSVLGSAACAADLPPLKKAIQLYDSGDYKWALHFVDTHLTKFPNDIYGRYWKANCLVKLKRLAESYQIYILVAQTVPKSKIGMYAKSEIAKMGRICSHSDYEYTNAPPPTDESFESNHSGLSSIPKEALPAAEKESRPSTREAPNE